MQLVLKNCLSYLSIKVKRHELKGIAKSSLPVWYYWNTKAWMVQSVFSHYLNRLDSMMRKENRKIILLADNATSHKTEEAIAKLTNVRVYFLPPNTTSALQPLDQGIIYSLKVCTFALKQ